MVNIFSVNVVIFFVFPLPTNFAIVVINFFYVIFSLSTANIYFSVGATRTVLLTIVPKS
jgi:hypothetical protein